MAASAAAEAAATPARKPKTIGVLAGGGDLPSEVAEAILARGDRVHVLALDGAAGPNMLHYPHTVVRWGGIGRILATLRERTDGELVFVGRVTRPDLRRLGPDLGFIVNFPALLKMMSGGDDAILTRVVRFFESKGVRVRGVHEVAPGLVAPEGAAGRLQMSAADEADFRLGRSVLDALSPYDVGQAVVVADGQLIGVEAAEGTDRMLERVASLRGDSAPTKPCGVLVKAPKRGQELRVDMPAIGPATIEKAAAAGLSGIAVTAGTVLIADRARTRELADAHGVFIHGFEAGALPPERQAAPRAEPFEDEAGHPLKRQDAADIARGVAVTRALASHTAGEGVVVSGRYVIAVSGPEGVATMLKRVPQLRQWGLGRRRRGVLTVRASALQRASDGDAILAAAWGANLVGIAVSGGDGSIISRARRDLPKGCFVVVAPSWEPGA